MLLRALHKAPYFKGRDRLSSAISASFAPKPTVTDGGFRMILDPYEWIQQTIILNGNTEPLTSKLMQQLLKPGDIFVDVGAHVGHHVLVAAKAVGASGKVIAIDPQPYNADRIGQNALLNNMRQVEVIPAAVSDREGFARFPFQSGRDRARFSLGGSSNDSSITFECPLRRLDNILIDRNIERVRLLKVDVEGFEAQVLTGLGTKLRYCDNIIFEQLPDDSGSAANILETEGFELKTVEGQPLASVSRLPEGNIWAELRCRPEHPMADSR